MTRLLPSARFACCLLGALLVTTPAVRAQNPGRGGGAARPRSTAVRAEFASVLLQAGRYDEAAREFRLLLARSPESFDYRLGLARALGWGEHPREAEAELRSLAARRPGDPEIEAMLRSVRANLEPRAVEAAGWVASEPFYAPYRAALARALVRERMPRLAIAHFDTLLLRGGAPGSDRSALVREMADAFVLAGDRGGADATLRRALDVTPADTSLRHALAANLAAGRRYDEAAAQYDSLIAVAPTGTLLTERARVRLASGDRRGAETDLSAALAMAPAADAYLLLGTLYRERGDYRAARVMLDAARARRDARIGLALSEARAQLAREERPVAAYAPALGDDPGWRIAEDAAADNLGVAYSTLTVRRTLTIAAPTVVSFDVEYRQILERANGQSRAASGHGAFAGLSHQAAFGWLLARAEVAGGIVYHPLTRTVPEGRAGVAVWVGPWQLSVEGASAAAYPTLFTMASLLRPDGGDPIVDRRATMTLGGPIGRLDAAVLWRQSRFSDGNARSEVQGLARFPLAPSLYAIYTASVLHFAERSALYWDPDRYVSHGAGLEYAVRRTHGLSLAARVLPAFASSIESLPLAGALPIDAARARGPLEQHTAVQLSGSGEATFRADRWEAAAALSYGRGRAGDYQRYGGTVTVRFAP